MRGFPRLSRAPPAEAIFFQKKHKFVVKRHVVGKMHDLIVPKLIEQRDRSTKQSRSFDRIFARRSNAVWVVPVSSQAGSRQRSF